MISLIRTSVATILCVSAFSTLAQDPIVAASPALEATPEMTGPRCYKELEKHESWVKPGGSIAPKMLRLKEGSQRLDFITGKSAFFAIKLSDVKQKYLLQVLLIRDQNITKVSTVLIPSYVLLDKNFCEIEGHKEFVFRDKKWVNALSQSLHVADVVIEEGQFPAYVILYSEAIKNGQEVEFRNASSGKNLPMTIRSEYGYLQIQAVKRSSR
jgi:hypothetical protein